MKLKVDRKAQGPVVLGSLVGAALRLATQAYAPQLRQMIPSSYGHSFNFENIVGIVGGSAVVVLAPPKHKRMAHAMGGALLYKSAEDLLGKVGL